MTYPLPEKTVLGQLRLLEVYDYYDGPRLFAAENESGGLFLGYWVNDDASGDTWFYVSVSRQRLRYIRSGGIPLRDALTASEDGVVIRVVFPPLGPAVVDAIDAKTLSEAELPPPHDVLQLPTQTIKPPRERPEDIARRTRREVIGIALSPSGYTRSETTIDLLSATTRGLQESLDEIGASYAIPIGAKQTVAKRQEIEDQTALVAMGTYGGSFGLLLGASRTPDLFGKSVIADAIAGFTQLLDAGTDLKLLQSRLTARVAIRYREFLSELARAESGLALEWGSPQPGRKYAAHFSHREIKRRAEVLSRTEYQVTKEIRIRRATLIGANLRLRRYEVRDEDTGATYYGYVEPGTVGTLRQAILDGTYSVRLQEVVERYLLTPEQTVRNVLVELTPVVSSTR